MIFTLHHNCFTDAIYDPLSIVRVDTTDPNGGTVYTDTVTTQGGVYSSDITDVSVHWDEFYDYESGIAAYRVRVYRKPSDSDENELVHSETVDGSVHELSWAHFSFDNGDSIYIEVRAENGAGKRMTRSSDEYVIDLTPPHLSYLVDGSDGGRDERFQSHNDSLSVSWSADDAESAIQMITISVWELSEGRRMLIYPDPLLPGETSIQIDPSLSTHTLGNLTLSHGMKYVSVLTLTNGAGLVSEYESSGVVVDTTPPLVTALSIDGNLVINEEEEEERMEYVVSSTDHVNVRWSAHDIESGISEVLVGIVDENNTLVSPTTISFSVHNSGGLLLGNLALVPGSQYRVRLTAVNQAQSHSQTTYSDEFRSATQMFTEISNFHSISIHFDCFCIIFFHEKKFATIFSLSYDSVVVDEVSGKVFDGENPALIDADYTDEATAVTVHFDGFSTTRCGGVLRYEWAVGDGWREGEQETVMRFTDRGIVVNSNGGSGYAQVYTCVHYTYVHLKCGYS